MPQYQEAPFQHQLTPAIMDPSTNMAASVTSTVIVPPAFLLLYLLSAHPHLRLDYDLMARMSFTNDNPALHVTAASIRESIGPYISAAIRTRPVFRNQKLQNAWQEQGGYWSEGSRMFVRIGMNWNKQLKLVVDRGYLTDDGTLIVRDVDIESKKTLETTNPVTGTDRVNCGVGAPVAVSEGYGMIELDIEAMMALESGYSANGISQGNCAVQTPVAAPGGHGMIKVDQHGMGNGHVNGGEKALNSHIYACMVDNNDTRVDEEMGNNTTNHKYVPGQMNSVSNGFIGQSMLDYSIVGAHERLSRMNELHAEYKRLEKEQKAFEAEVKTQNQDQFHGQVKVKRSWADVAAQRTIQGPTPPEDATKNGQAGSGEEERVQKMTQLRKEYVDLCEEHERVQSFGFCV